MLRFISPNFSTVTFCLQLVCTSSKCYLFCIEIDHIFSFLLDALDLVSLNRNSLAFLICKKDGCKFGHREKL